LRTPTGRANVSRITLGVIDQRTDRVRKIAQAPRETVLPHKAILHTLRSAAIHVYQSMFADVRYGDQTQLLSMPDAFSLIAVASVFLLCLSLLIVQAITGVPAMSANAAEAADVIALLKQARVREDAVIYDLGSGWGALVVALARAFPNAQIRGIEMSPLPYCVAWLRTRHRPNVSIQWGNFYARKLGDADAITCYLMIKPMPKLAAFLDRALKAGTPVVALTFWFRDRAPDAVREGLGLRGAAALYYWPALRDPKVVIPGRGRTPANPESQDVGPERRRARFRARAFSAPRNDAYWLNRQCQP
jgi:2-polyprenyl-3-methyl-5-hydroxy-6-metoxy-1,4-benzoquinol methylase